jgi:mono/diheme cytochrome c family protein
MKTGLVVAGAALIIACALMAGQALAQSISAAPAASAGRGELLYSTHCGACHSTQMHWRENKRATDWDSLKAQVRRWQGVAQLDWTEADVEQVARYLNQTIYGYPEPARVGLLAVPRVDTP